MDRKISTPEILDVIFSHLAYCPSAPGWFGCGARDLAALARTCKTFRDPALDILWRRQDSLTPAVRCLPGDLLLWDRVGKSKKKSFSKFKRPMVDQDWDRPHFYWNRIQSLRIRSSYDGFTIRGSSDIAPELWQPLQQCYPGGNLFPNLIEIEWDHPDPAIYPVISLFLAPRIHTLTLGPGPHANYSYGDLTSVPDPDSKVSTAQVSLLPTLVVTCPDLKEVYFRGVFFSSDVLSNILLCLMGISRLEAFGIHNVDHPILEHLSRLSWLKSLIIDELLAFDLPTSSDADSAGGNHFAALEELRLWATTPQVAIALIAAATHRPLTSLVIVFEKGYPNADTIAELYSIIATHCSPATLESLHMDDAFIYAKSADMLDERDFESYLVDSGALRPLLTFTNLKTVLLRPYFGFDIDDSMVTEMAKAWSRVEELTLTFGVDQHLALVRTEVTLNGVREIARHCSKLRELDLFFDASDVPRLDLSIHQMSLVNLKVACSPISSSGPAAIFLSHLFPNLKSVNSYCCWFNNGMPAAVRRWHNVATLLRGVSTYSRIQREDSDTDDEDF
ncbi:hypothetical protein C8R43DRAFT_1240431 [Mycena crocata]|nr:hypothetical protein C8R43DRAFT_1240431 [Mycena crocata]